MGYGLSVPSCPKHKTFISFHSVDNYERLSFESQWGEQFDSFISKSVKEGDIGPSETTERTRQVIRDDYISDATVSVVLIGNGTWRRKHVDWEIGSSIRDTKKNSRTGLIGILLPSYSTGTRGLFSLTQTEDGALYNPYTIPPRLYDNVECGFAKIYSYPKFSNDLLKWIDDAFKRRKKVLPNNSRDSFSRNRSELSICWE